MNYLKLLQLVSAEPISLSGGKFVRFPKHMPESFDLDVVKGLKGYSLIRGRYRGVVRFVLRAPGGKILNPMPQARTVSCWLDGKVKYFNVMNLLASCILNKDVTDNEYGILYGGDGLWIESGEDRQRLRNELRLHIPDLPRVDMTIITRPNSGDIEVTGKGYYVRGGVVYARDNTPLRMEKGGLYKMTDCNRKPATIHVGRVLFTAYPDFYQFDPASHTEIDHIDGDHTNNEPGNLRPVTTQQNRALSHRTGTRMARPGPSSSHEQFKRVFGTLSTTTIERMISTGALRQFEETVYWVHTLGAVFRKRQDGTFEYAEVRINRKGITVSGIHNRYIHNRVMILKAFGEYGKDGVIVHLNGNKHDDRLVNLRRERLTTTWNSNQVTIYFHGGSKQTFPSENEAARTIGVSVSALRENRKSNRQRKKAGPAKLLFRQSRYVWFAAT
jgi:hypothetical protein